MGTEFRGLVERDDAVYYIYPILLQLNYSYIEIIRFKELNFSLKCFLQLHVALQLCQNKKFNFKKLGDNFSRIKFLNIISVRKHNTLISDPNNFTRVKNLGKKFIFIKKFKLTIVT